MSNIARFTFWRNSRKTGKSFGGNPVNLIMQASDSGIRYQDKPAECPWVERAIALMQ